MNAQNCWDDQVLLRGGGGGGGGGGQLQNIIILKVVVTSHELGQLSLYYCEIQVHIAGKVL